MWTVYWLVNLKELTSSFLMNFHTLVWDQSLYCQGTSQTNGPRKTNCAGRRSLCSRKCTRLLSQGFGRLSQVSIFLFWVRYKTTHHVTRYGQKRFYPNSIFCVWHFVNRTNLLNCPERKDKVSQSCLCEETPNRSTCSSLISTPSRGPRST